MSDTLFDKFIFLVKLDQRIYNTSQKHKEAQYSLEVVQKQIEQLKQQLEISKQELSKLQRQVDYQDLELRTIDSKIKEKKLKFDYAKTQKEYESLESEIRALEREQEFRDEELVLLWQELESKHCYCVKIEEQSYEQIQEEHKKFQEIDNLIKLLLEDIKELESERKAVIADIPDDFISRYLSMVNEVHNAAIEVKFGMCGMCSGIISANDIMLLRKRKLVDCKQCYRILYIESE